MLASKRLASRWPGVLWTIAATLSVSLTLNACLGTDTSDLSTEELVIVANQEPQSLEGQLTYREINAVGLRNVVEQLTTINPETGELEPMLATSWEQLSPTRWRFHLRRGVKFHDGSPFNAKSAAFALKWVWSPDNNFTIRETAGPDFRAEVVDEYTMDVVTEEPDPLLARRFYLSGLTSMKQIQQNPKTYGDTPIGTGPYKFVKWERGRYWLAEANPDWWGHDDADAYGNVNFDRVRVLFRNEGTVRAGMVETGEAHLAMFIDEHQCADLNDHPELQCVSEASDTYMYARLDHTDAHPSLSDPRLREAFFSAIDTVALSEAVLVQATPLHGQLVTDAAVGFSPRLEQYPYDPKRARQLIEDVQADGVEVPPLHIAARQGASPRINEVIEAIGGMLDEVGWENEVAYEEEAVFNEWVTTKPTSKRSSVMVHVGQNPFQDFTGPFLELYACPNAITVYCNEAFDERVAKAHGLVGEDRERAMQRLNEYIHDEYVVLPIAQLERAYGLAAGLEWKPWLDHAIYAVDIVPTEP